MRTPKLKIPPKLLSSILPVLLSILATLLVIELALRVSYREEEINGNYWGRGAFSSSDATGYVHTPGFEGHALRPGVFRSPVSINSMGLRQENLEEQLRFPKKLLILGDSFAFGLGVTEQQSFPHLIQSGLNDHDIGVINGAQTGYSVEQERLLGATLLEQLEPDLVILGLFAQNDIQGDYYQKHRNIDVAYGYRLRKDRWLGVGPVDFLRTHSYLWMWIHARLQQVESNKRSTEFSEISKMSLPEVMQPTLKAIASLRDLCDDQGILFGVVMIPPRSGNTIFDDRLKAFFQEENIAFADLGPEGFGMQEYFRGDGHWNENGHEKASRFIEPFALGLFEEGPE